MQADQLNLKPGDCVLSGYGDVFLAYLSTHTGGYQGEPELMLTDCDLSGPVGEFGADMEVMTGPERERARARIERVIQAERAALRVCHDDYQRRGPVLPEEVAELKAYTLDLHNLDLAAGRALGLEG